MQIFFHAGSWLVKLLELAVIFFIGFVAHDLFSGDLTFFQGFFFLLLFLFFLANKICTLRHWYPHLKRGAGIERHFFASWMLSVYTLFFAFLLFLLWQNALVFFLACLPLVFFTHFHPILIAFSLKDRSLLAPNAFSHPEFTRNS